VGIVGGGGVGANMMYELYSDGSNEVVWAEFDACAMHKTGNKKPGESDATCGYTR
jgi:hypothetical protein